MKRLFVLLATLMLTACAAESVQPQVIIDGVPSTQAKVCKKARSQMCTREYRPVCTVMADGSRKTASNACTACSDEKVIGYTPAPCAADLK